MKKIVFVFIAAILVVASIIYTRLTTPGKPGTGVTSNANVQGK